MALADIIAKQGVDIDEAHKLLIADRDAFVADENDEHPETHPYQDNFAETLGKDSYGGDYIIDEAAEFWAHRRRQVGRRRIRRSVWRASVSAAT